MTLRVPENRFDAVMEQLRDLGQFSNEKTGDDDVTMPYLDLEARLKTLETQEVRLREILAKAETVGDMLVSVNCQARQDRILSAQFKHRISAISTINVVFEGEVAPLPRLPLLISVRG